MNKAATDVGSSSRHGHASRQPDPLAPAAGAFPLPSAQSSSARGSSTRAPALAPPRWTLSKAA